MKLLYFPLTRQDVAWLREGKLIIKNYFPPFEPHKLLCVVAWNKSILKKLDKRKFDAMRQAGIDVANIPLNNDALTKIVNGDGISVFYSNFEVLVVTEEILHKLERAKELLQK